MPIHDWRRVESGIFYDFHHTWITEIKRTLNDGLLPNDYYALAEQIVGSFGPDVLPLEGPGEESSSDDWGRGGVALAEVQPQVSFHVRTEADIYAAKASKLVIHHVTDHRVVAVIEIVSPGNKSSLGPIRTFVEKAENLLRNGVHLLVIHLFSPTPRDPEGIHKLIWQELDHCNFILPKEHPLTLASYMGGFCQEAFIEPVRIGATLPDMPLFLTTEIYIQVPLEKTYQSAFAAVPAIWRRKLENV